MKLKVISTPQIYYATIRTKRFIGKSTTELPTPSSPIMIIMTIVLLLHNAHIQSYSTSKSLCKAARSQAASRLAILPSFSKLHLFTCTSQIYDSIQIWHINFRRKCAFILEHTHTTRMVYAMQWTEEEYVDKQVKCNHTAIKLSPSNSCQIELDTRTLCLHLSERLSVSRVDSRARGPLLGLSC